MSKKIINTIDLWNDHKPSQTIDPFLADYFDEENMTFAYDKVVLAPNLVGNYQVKNPLVGGGLDASICPRFNGGLIFLKNGTPIRLYLFQVNDIVTEDIGHEYGMDEVFATLNSDRKIANTGKTLLQLLAANKVEIEIDKSIKSKFKSEKGYVCKNDPVLESADQMSILKSGTFLDKPENWEAVSFNPELVMNLSVEGDDFEINIQHEGYIVGVKKNVEGLRESQDMKKLYGIALQTGDAEEWQKMVQYAIDFERQVGNLPSEETRAIDLDKSLLDL